MIDPKGNARSAELRAADYQALVRDALRAEFPGVTDRVDRRLLDGILSSGAADDLRDRVVSDPSVIGKTIDIPVIIVLRSPISISRASAPAIVNVTGQGSATPDGTSGEVTIRSTSSDFANTLGLVKQSLIARARSISAKPTACSRLPSGQRSERPRWKPLSRPPVRPPARRGFLRLKAISSARPIRRHRWKRASRI